MEQIPQTTKINVAITGCIHGALHKLYTDLQAYEQLNKKKIHLVLCTGDFECFKTKADLDYMECPDRYRVLGDFPDYYNGHYPVPYLTIFIGGNHEASNILHENFFGGWIMERVYYLGRAGVIKVKGIRIAGSSGIFKENSYLKSHFEVNLLKNIRTIYHLREFEVAKLSRLTGPIDIMMSHDWPTDIVDTKDINGICKIKRNWRKELETKTLGSYPNEFLLNYLKPKNWICGHMHYTYKNQIKHLDGSCTNVYALDKCLEQRPYFDVIEFDVKNVNGVDVNDDSIYVDGQWIEITKVFNDFFPFKSGRFNYSANIPNQTEYNDTLGGINIDSGKEINIVVIPKEKLDNLTKTVTNDKKVEMIENQTSYMIDEIFQIGNKTIEIVNKKEKNNEEIKIDIDI